MEFFNSASTGTLHWNDVWEQWQPVTVYGQDVKRQLTPFLPGDEALWQGVVQVLQQDVQVLNRRSVRTVQTSLNKLPDIRGISARLLSTADTNGHVSSGSPAAGLFTKASPADPLPAAVSSVDPSSADTSSADPSSADPASVETFSAKELLQLKQFAFYGRALSLEWGQMLSGLLAVETWDLLLRLFGSEEEPSFSIQHVASSDYHFYMSQLAQTQRSLSQAVRHWRESWRGETGLTPDQDGLIHCKLPQHRQLAEQLKQNTEAQWLQETPFESVFATQTPEAVTQLQEQQDDIRFKMDQEAHRALQELSSTLRDYGEVWKEAIAHISELDLRVSKAALWLSWSAASVPGMGDQLRIEGAVHPILESQFVQAGRSYVPLDWELNMGLSVLSGSNMGGKTVALSLLIVCQLCAQYGLPVPARHFETRLFQTIRYYAGMHTQAGIGADIPEAAVSSGLSSFGVEIAQISDGWKCIHEGKPALICFDEPAKSTNPVEGEAVVVGLVRTLQELKPTATVVIATHFPQAASEPGVVQYRVRGLRQQSLAAAAAAAPAVNESDGADGTGVSEPDGAVSNEAVSNEVEPDGAVQSSIPLSQRLKALADAMDYRLERIDKAQWSEEGLQVAEWIGLPAEILLASRRYRRLRLEQDTLEHDT